jgi:hypothetical protein
VADVSAVWEMCPPYGRYLRHGRDFLQMKGNASTELFESHSRKQAKLSLINLSIMYTKGQNSRKSDTVHTDSVLLSTHKFKLVDEYKSRLDCLGESGAPEQGGQT